MTTRKGKRAAKSEETDSTEELAEAVRSALKAAQLADDAAADIESLKAENAAFIRGTQSLSKKMSALAIGAMAGAFIAVTLSGLVYFRSVKDLRENAELQAQLLAEILTQTAALEEVVVQAGNQQGSVVREISTEIANATDRLSAEMASYATDLSSFQPQTTTGMGDEIAGSIDTLNGTVISDMETLRSDILGAIGDLEMSMTEVCVSASGGIAPDVTNEVSILLEELRGTVSAVQTMTTSQTRTTTPASSPRPASRPTAQAAPAPNPFSFP